MLCEFNEIIPKDCLSVETKKEYETRKLLELNEDQIAFVLFFIKMGFGFERSYVRGLEEYYEDQANIYLNENKK